MRDFVGAGTLFPVEQHNVERNWNPLVLYLLNSLYRAHISVVSSIREQLGTADTGYRVHQKGVLV